ncbi:653_t:CDS:2, partial [Rhizophagus irregularis]
RRGHTATLFDKKLYILGGFPLEEIGNEFFYIDFSVSFNTQNLKVNDLTNINTLSPHYNAGSAIGGTNNDTLFICGGLSNVKYATMELVNTFNPRSNSWSIPKIAGDKPFLVDCDMTTINYDIYILSALDVSDINILDTINLVWKKVNPIGTQNIGAASSSILLPDNKIIYIDSSNTGNLAEVYIYDTVNNNWSKKTTTGTIPPKKDGGSAVLGLDGKRIITFGGFVSATQDQLHELNLINFEWRIPKSSGSIPASRSHHKANVIGNYMVLSFGSGYKKNNENDILLLDITPIAITGTSSFLSPTSSSLSPKVSSVSSGYNDQNSNKISTGVTVILLICGGAFIIVVSILLRKCNNRMNRMIYGSNYTIQIPVPASLINNDINRNVVYYNQANSNNSNPRQEIVQQPVAINNVNDRRNRNEVRQPIVIYDVNNRRNRNEVQQPVAINNVKDRRNRNELQQPVVINNVKDRRNRNENGDNNYQTERNNYYPGQEIVQQPEVINNDNRNESNYHPGQEIVQPPAPASIINTNYNHGRESVPIANYEIQILKQEIQDLKQIILQNNKQSTSSTSNN